MACHIAAWPWQCRPVSFPVDTKSTSFSSRTLRRNQFTLLILPTNPTRWCKRLFKEHAEAPAAGNLDFSNTFLSLVPSTTAERIVSFAAVWKAPFKRSFGGSGGVARRHWGIAKMAAVSEGMKTVTLCYQSFQSVPCPCGALLCARRCSHAGAADAAHWPQHVQVWAPVSCERVKQMHGGDPIWGGYLR